MFLVNHCRQPLAKRLEEDYIKFEYRNESSLSFQQEV